MAHIKVKKGLKIPLAGCPVGPLQELDFPPYVALDLRPFEEIKGKLLIKVGDRILSGQPVLVDKKYPDRIIVAPAAGIVKAVNRGLKQRLLEIIIETSAEQSYFDHGRFDVVRETKESLFTKLLSGGILAHARMRPCNRPIIPTTLPKSIFVQAVDSAPYAPPFELEVEGFEELFQYGLFAFSRLADKKIHLIFRKNTECKAFTEAQEVQRHTVAGPHPAGNPSLHISQIDPIFRNDHIIWTLNVHDVICAGRLLREGIYHPTRVISVAGTPIPQEKRGFFRVNAGYPIIPLISSCAKQEVRTLSGDPLTGRKVTENDYLGFSDRVVCAIPEAQDKRQFFHFGRLGKSRFSLSKAYFSSHLKTHAFTTHQHGEIRAFVDSILYDRVMPLPIPTMPLIKAILAEDFEKAKEFGLLEIAPEDFALSSFVCPSKIDMISIVKEGLRSYVTQYLE